jgi:hypothetical protein
MDRCRKARMPLNKAQLLSKSHAQARLSICLPCAFHHQQGGWAPRWCMSHAIEMAELMRCFALYCTSPRYPLPSCIPQVHVTSPTSTCNKSFASCLAALPVFWQSQLSKVDFGPMPSDSALKAGTCNACVVRMLRLLVAWCPVSHPLLDASAPCQWLPGTHLHTSLGKNVIVEVFRILWWS